MEEKWFLARLSFKEEEEYLFEGSKQLMGTVYRQKFQSRDQVTLRLFLICYPRGGKTGPLLKDEEAEEGMQESQVNKSGKPDGIGANQD